MGANDWAVLVAGVAGIAWVNWYFFLAERGSAAAARGPGGAQQVTVGVEGGYSPASVRLERGVPARLVFDRRETSSCSEEVVIPDFGVRRFLPAHEKTTVEITPDRVGSYEFTCGMGMLRGRITVVDETEA